MKIIRNILLLMLISLCGQAYLSAQEISRYEIIINEIMADPTPTIGLPAAEYLELHSRLSEPCTLRNWDITIGTSTKKLPDITIDSAGYALIIASKYLEEFVGICDNIYTLSSLSITDAGQTITLSDPDGNVIHTVTFKNKWHSESIKRDGGWSLELLDESIPWVGSGNWDSSTSEVGGTPGASNAAAREIGDFTPPSLERVTLLDSTTIRLFFTESICPETPISTELFSLTPNVDISRITEVAPTFSSLDITLLEPLHPNVRYLLCVNGSLADCAGNGMAQECLPVSRTSPPAPGDLVINEVLSHPFSGTDADFIEIFNRSSKTIDLKEIKIGSGGDTIPSKAVIAVSSGRQLFPNDYCAICKDKSLTAEQYYCPSPTALQQCDSLPSYANGSGTVFLSTIGLTTIDKFIYSEEMHYSGLTNTEGVSLERLRADRPTQDDNNWHSAAANVGFATPGYLNSQAADNLTEEDLVVTPAAFSPNNDGFEDYTEFQLRFTDLENRLTISIFSKDGHLVRHLVNNEPCGREALFRWDGTDDYQRLLPSGYYVAVIQWWNANGRTERRRKAVAIVGS